MREVRPLLCCVPFLTTLAFAQDAPSEPIQDTGRVIIPGARKLEVSGQYRLRFENRHNYDLSTSRADDADFFLQRARLGFDIDIDEQLSAFFQLQDVRLWGEETSTIDASADGFDLHQGYVKLADVPGLGGTTKIGRQTINLGDQRLIGSLEWLNQGRSFDGIRQTWDLDDETWRIDAYVFQIDESGVSTNFGDAFVVGGQATHFTDVSELDLYVIFVNTEETAAGGTANRTTLGSRWIRQFGNLEFGTEVATQVGEQDGADIPIGETFAAHAHVLQRFDDSPSTARLEVNLASGNDPNSSDNERFDNLFPTAHGVWGIIDFAFWENMMHFMGEWRTDTTENSDLAVSWHYFRTFEEGDAFRGPNATLSAGAPGISNTMGNELDVIYTHRFDHAPAKTSVQVGFSLFIPGAGAIDANGDDDLAHFFYVQGDLRF